MKLLPGAKTGGGTEGSIILGDSAGTAVLSVAGTGITAAQSVVVAKDDSTNTGVTDVLTVSHSTSSTAGTGIGVGVVFQLEDAGGNQDEAASIEAE